MDLLNLVIGTFLFVAVVAIGGTFVYKNCSFGGLEPHGGYNPVKFRRSMLTETMTGYILIFILLPLVIAFAKILL